MMNDLVVPLLLARLQVDADDALAVQVVAGTMTPIEVRCRRLDRQVNQPQLFIDRDAGPHARVAVDRPRFLLPGFTAGLARPRHRLERPEQLPRPPVESAKHAYRVVVRSRRPPFLDRRADDDDDVSDSRRGMKAGR